MPFAFSEFFFIYEKYKRNYYSVKLISRVYFLSKTDAENYIFHKPEFILLEVTAPKIIGL